LTAIGNSDLKAGGNLAVSGNTTKNLTTSTTNGGATSFGVTRVGGNLGVTSSGDVWQGGALEVTGTTGISATGKNITLADASNDFKSTITASGADVAFGDSNGIELAAIVTTGTLGVSAKDAITQKQGSFISAGGASTISSATGDIVLLNASNDFQGTFNGFGMKMALWDMNSIELGNVAAAGTFDLSAANDITQKSGTTIVVAGVTTLASTTGNIELGGATNDFQSTLKATGKDVMVADANTLEFDNITTTGTFGLSAGSNITQKSGTRITSAGTTSLASTSGDIVLLNATNDFQGTFNGSGMKMALWDMNAIELGNVAAAGTFDLSAANDITQKSGTTIAVAGVTTLASTNGNIELGSATNDFQSTLKATGRDVMVADTSSIELGDITTTGRFDLTAGSDITQKPETTIIVPGITTLASKSGNISLGNATNDFQSTLNVSGKDVTIVDINSVELGNVTTTGMFDVLVTNDITQKSGTGITTAGSTSLKAEKGIITFAVGGTHFSGPIIINAGGAPKTPVQVDQKKLMTTSTLMTTTSASVPPPVLVISTGVTSTGGATSSGSTSTGGQSSSESTSTGGQSSLESTSTGGQSSLESTSTGGQSSLESTSTGGQSSSESTSSETSSADNGGADKSKGVSGAPAAPVVQLISMPKQDLSGVIMVTVTEKTFSFSLPENLQSQIVNTGSTVKISMADGGSLPGWLKYNAETKTFAAKNAPNNGKPVNVVVIIDNVKWTISINNLVTQ
jgi:hypothetical protein